MIQTTNATVYLGNNLDILPTLPDNSVDSIVTDPPYGLSDNKFVAETLSRWISGERDFIPDGKGFMGKAWDAFVPPPALWDECMRVLKPGGHLLAFFGSRTQDIGALSIRLAGFEIRDSIAWMYGSGFPKSLDISKAIDKAAGAEREVVGEKYSPDGIAYSARYKTAKSGGILGDVVPANPLTQMQTAPSTPEAKQWEGWGTALKPAFEPIIVARKPLEGKTVAENVLTHGTGGLNIDGSRIDYASQADKEKALAGDAFKRIDTSDAGWSRPWMSDPEKVAKLNAESKERAQQGRWPANVILDEYTAGLLDEQSGQSKSNAGNRGLQVSGQAGGLDGEQPNYKAGTDYVRGHNDSGGASRFFYCAKASKRDRNEGLNLCTCDKLNAWENEGQRAKHQVDTDQSARKVIAESGTTISSDTEWNTSLSGNESEAQSLTAGKSITLTEISSTTQSVTSSLLIQSPTSDFTQDANSETESGSNPAKSAKTSNPLTPQDGISPKKDGHNTEDADSATSGLSSSPNKTGANQCANCLGIIGGHPTVKPTDLMRYLVKLVTPPNGTVLDPFTGSGSTGKAAILEGFRFIGIELTEDYYPIIQGRLEHAEQTILTAAQEKKEELF